MANFTPRNWTNGYVVQNTDLIDLEQRIAAYAAKAGVDVFEPANQAAMLALSTAEKGDIAFRQDTGTTYVLVAEPASTLANWKAQPIPTSVVGKVEVWPLSRYGAVVAGADHTPLFQAFYDEVQTLSSNSAGAKLVLPPGFEARCSGIPIRRRMHFDLQGGTIRHTAAENTTPLFTADGTSTTEITLENGQIVTDNTVIRMIGTNGTGAQQATVENIRVISPETITSAYKTHGNGIADYFVFQSVDFLRFKNVKTYGGNKSFVIKGAAGTDRGNTQVSITEYCALYVRLGADLGLVDKGRFNIDVSHCGSGILLRNANAQMILDNCHVEYFGVGEYTSGLGVPYTRDLTYAERDGRAFMLNVSSTQHNPQFNACDAFAINGPNAVAGFEHYAATGVVYHTQDYPTPHYKGCRTRQLAGIPNTYKPVDLWPAAVWDGVWNFVDESGSVDYNANVSTHKKTITVTQWNDVVVRPQGVVGPQTSNLLTWNRIRDLNDVPSNVGTAPTIATHTGSVPRAVDVTFTASGTRYGPVVTTKAGWHTLVVQGKATNTNGVIQVEGSVSGNLVQTPIYSHDTTNGQIYRIPFYVPSDQNINIGVAAYGATVLTIGRIGVHRGLVNELRDRVWEDTYPDLASAATLPKPYAPIHRVTGSTDITAIQPGYSGQRVTLYFQSALKLTDGVGLRLEGDFYALAGSVLELFWDSATSDWRECGRTRNQDVYPTLASAATLAVPTAEITKITGSTGITSITAGFPGQRAILHFTGTLTVTDGSNLKLNGNLNATPDTTLNIFCDGTNWIEIGRSVN